ncbi:MAG: alanine racemase [Gammaproteobacteria bacterium]|nr:alanine racemase [Gammaproteobacteria bacterium]
MMRAARALIDRSALLHNFQRVREAAPHSRVLAVVKANAYGHGAVTVAQTLGDAHGFGVACVDEGLALRAAGIDKTVVSLQGFKSASQLVKAAANNIDVTVYDAYQIELLAATSLAAPVRVWLKVDTGMARLGFAPTELAAVHRRVTALPRATTAPVLMTHLACADERRSDYSRQQLDTFERATAALSGKRSVANSAGILAWPGSHGDWVRPGIMLYGASPFVDDTAEHAGLKPVMTLTAPLITRRWMHAGEHVGYGNSWTAPEAMPIGVAAIGYADGYPRHASTGTPVLINGQRTQLVGRVCMDMITIDLRGCDAAVGDDVTLWGKDLPVDEVARNATTVGYDLLCAAGNRVRAEIVN